MKRVMILVMFAVLAVAVSTISAQQSRAVFKGMVSNSTGIKFSDWYLTLVAGKPLVIKQVIDIRQAHTFTFKAQKGQKISIKVVSKEPSAAFVVYDNKEDGEQIGGSSEENMSWQGEFEADGEYKIVLSADGKSPYTMTVKIS